ncbi:hypothetical protein RHGRI_010466 [Rhododendron griersonianum]|uniref:CCR4-NOT transcription complex subunit 1 CAF1-binding domain-containing protein n=1 Tax=Rhododendron griersonianum TaxID=479676 RepID=A0AAV6KIP0_9ERIC|nr:hypothetical protein RHGRI_010466 [Rhododendron griersonianum]
MYELFRCIIKFLRTGFGCALNIEALVAAAERKETPLEFGLQILLQRYSRIRHKTKAKEFSEILTEQYYSWFAQYMVMKRASIEPNFPDLYLKFIDKVNSKPLNKEIVQATYENCKGRSLQNQVQKSVPCLKNLGSWLGKITIGRNQVSRAREIDPKSLIIEAYEKGLMIAAIPFTSKTIKDAKYPKASPRNGCPHSSIGSPANKLFAWAPSQLRQLLLRPSQTDSRCPISCFDLEAHLSEDLLRFLPSTDLVLESPPPLPLTTANNQCYRRQPPDYEIADDAQGRGILKELEADDVDTSFLVVSKKGNSPFTYLIVDNQT